MSAQGYEFTGKSVEAAVAEGLKQLGLSQQQVEIEILNEGRRGLLGIGSMDARVRITPRSSTKSTQKTAEKIVAEQVAEGQSDLPAAERRRIAERAEAESPFRGTGGEETEEAADRAKPAEPAAQAVQPMPAVEIEPEEELESLARELLQGMLNRMGIQAQVVGNWRENPEDQEFQLILDIQGDDLGVLIGRRGETLADIQYLLRLMVNQRIHRWTNIVVDVEQYKSRREERLNKMALRLAEQVVSTGKSVTLEPMPAAERRLVHLALRNHAQVYTQSVGEGERRKVQILLNE
jgi:spoIIIJ-associated protein